jgi:hypothetical protein
MLKQKERAVLAVVFVQTRVLTHCLLFGGERKREVLILLKFKTT